MLKLKILNSREKKKLLEELSAVYGIKQLKLDYVFMQNPKGRIYITNRDIEKIPLEKLRINSLGLYFAMQDRVGLRLSVEGSQIIGKHATKNIIELNQEQAQEWFSGRDIETQSQLKGFVLVKHKNDFLGCGNLSKGILHNYLGKERRIKTLKFQ